MKELRNKLTSILRNDRKHSLKTLKKYAEQSIARKVSEEDILNSFFDILIYEINSYNFKQSPDKINYVFRIFKLINKHINYIKNGDITNFANKVKELDKVIEEKEVKSIKVQKGNHKVKVEEFFARLKNETVLLKVQLNIKDEEDINFCVSEEEMEEFLKYVVLNIKNYDYVEILYVQNPDLMNFKIKGDKYLLDKVLTKYLEALKEYNDKDAIYFERVVNLFIENENFQMTEEYKKSLVKRLNVFLDNLEYSTETDRLKKKAHLFLESTIDRLNSVEQDYSDDDIEKLNQKYGIVDKNNIYGPQSISKSIIYTDMTDRRIITIDGDNTSCYDDAISFDILPNGNYRVGIYISDVADYIRKPSRLDYLAYKQGNTLYLPNNIVPMLPNYLATDTCSLVEKEIRYVVAFTFEFNSNFELISDNIKRAAIKVNKNYGTTEVDRLLERKDSLEEYELLKKIIMFSDYLASKNSNVEDYHQIKELLKGNEYESSIGHSALSQYMVFLNNFVANRFDQDKSLPFIYRINGTVYNTEQLESLKDKIKLNPTLEELMIHVQDMYVPSLYSTINSGHRGLGLDAYAHTTSPIRNYASLTNQRLILDFLVDQNFDRLEEWQDSLPTVVDNLNSSKEKMDEYRKEYIKILAKKKKINA